MYTLRWLALASFLTGLSMLAIGFAFGGDDASSSDRTLDPPAFG